MNRGMVLENCIRGLTLFEDRFDTVEPEDASWICERLAWHKVFPLAAALSDPFTHKCDELQNHFNRVIIDNMVRERSYEKQVHFLFQFLRDNNVDFIPYKGPFWCRSLYPDYLWRHIGDIDLMMDIDHARKASALLQARGYRPDIMEESEENDFVMRGELTLFPNSSVKNEFPVQLHWNPLPSPRFLKKQFMPVELFNYGSSPSVWKGIRFSVPRLEIQFFYYILHATCQHQFLRFSHLIAPIHLLIKSAPLDWKLIYELTLRQEVQTPFFYGMKFIDTFYPLSEQAREFMNRLNPRLTSRFAATFLQPSHILSATQEQGRWRRELFRVAMSW